ncbi:hypothetical protein VTL71DRAFT_6476 [Oculimacula yallundae]|uniref:Uncharacterized protein n=1 Tax=Oculimacula yallundae TaxID=86028 RepID=A0ABR4BX25_9HELO
MTLNNPTVTSCPEMNLARLEAWATVQYLGALAAGWSVAELSAAKVKLPRSQISPHPLSLFRVLAPTLVTVSLNQVTGAVMIIATSTVSSSPIAPFHKAF